MAAIPTGQTFTILDLSTQDIINIISIGINKSLSINFSTLVRRNNISDVFISIPEENLSGTVDLSYNGIISISGKTEGWDKASVLNYVDLTLDTDLDIGKSVQFPYKDGYVVMTITGLTETTLPTKNNAQTIKRTSIVGPITNSVNTSFTIGETIRINTNNWDILIT